MKNSRIWILISIAILLSAVVFAQGRLKADHSSSLQEALPTFSQQTIKFGSTGEDVYELQGRLKHLGFYHGKIDSVFGSKTQGAVKWFQSEFGMKVDGVVGPKVKLKLYNATRISVRPLRSFMKAEVQRSVLAETAAVLIKETTT